MAALCSPQERCVARDRSVGFLAVGIRAVALLVASGMSASAQELTISDLGQVSLSEGRPNILVIVADDLGVDRVAAYAEHPDPGHTPVIDGLAEQGVLFRNAWSNPGCSPTRATILSGRYSFRTQIGRVIIFETSTFELDAASHSLARAVAGPVHSATPLHEPGFHGPPSIPLVQSQNYLPLAVGKWHLSTAAGSGMPHPLLMGFAHHRGSMDNLPDNATPMSFFAYEKAVDGVAEWSTTYATTDQVDDALELIGGTTRPWFLYLAFNAPHAPYHVPPADLHTFDISGDHNAPLLHKAMTEAMDTEIGRLLAGIPQAVLDNTFIIFVGDNGTPNAATTAPFVVGHGKGTPYEGALNVPLIVVGPGVAQDVECEALVNTTDLFATVCDLAGAKVDPGPDSVSLLPYLVDPELPSLRSWVYAEAFSPNGPGPYYNRSQMIRERRYKYIHQTMANGQPVSKEQFYDLVVDPFESDELLRHGPLAPAQQAAYDQLVAVLATLK